MPWTKLDDGFHEHPKTVAMSDKAYRLFTSSLTYASRHKLRGRLTAAHLAVLFRLTRATNKHVDELIALRSYEIDGGDIVIHDFEDFNPTSEELSKKRAYAGRIGAEKRWGERAPMANAIDLPSETVMANDGTGIPRAGDPLPVPDSPTHPKDTLARPSAPRGTRLESPFNLPDEWREFAEGERPHFDARIEGQKFADYWHSVPGVRALKTDWFATWRNFVRSDMYGRGQKPLKGLRPGLPTRTETMEDRLLATQQRRDARKATQCT